MEAFNISEKYRKYLVKLAFSDINLYTVWGTDMIDDEQDKLLVNREKLLTFETLNGIGLALKVTDHPFTDRENYAQWVKEESLNNIYALYDFSLIEKFEPSFAETADPSLGILNCLNLIQDFLIQINNQHDLAAFSSPLLLEFKSWIYDSYYWNSGRGQGWPKLFGEEDLQELKCILKDICEHFKSRIKVIS